jgi:predicted nucleic acid-binding protein
LRVADSSYLVEGLLKRKELFEDEDFLLTLDLAVYEVANSIWKHEFLLKDVEDGIEYIAILQGLIESGKIRLLHAGKEIMKSAYSIASKNKRPLYDCVFIALALELSAELATYDRRQVELLQKASAE